MTEVPAAQGEGLSRCPTENIGDWMEADGIGWDVIQPYVLCRKSHDIMLFVLYVMMCYETWYCVKHRLYFALSY